jgi:hypothetical protein
MRKGYRFSRQLRKLGHLPLRHLIHFMQRDGYHLSKYLPAELETTRYYWLQGLLRESEGFARFHSRLLSLRASFRYPESLDL